MQKKKKILLVDDSRVTREVIKVYFVAENCSLIEAADGIEALEQVHRHRPDLIIADLRMPRLDGPGFCRALKADPSIGHLPVVILTSNRNPESVQICLESGAREVLAKPIQPKDLLSSVRRYLSVTF